MNWQENFYCSSMISSHVKCTWTKYSNSHNPLACVWGSGYAAPWWWPNLAPLPLSLLIVPMELSPSVSVRTTPKRPIWGTHCGHGDTVHPNQPSTSFQPRVGFIKAGLSHCQHVYTMWGELQRTLSKFSGANYPNQDPYSAKVILSPDQTDAGFHCRWVVGLSA